MLFSIYLFTGFQIIISFGEITDALNHQLNAHNSNNPIHTNALQEPGIILFSSFVSIEIAGGIGSDDRKMLIYHKFDSRIKDSQAIKEMMDFLSQHKMKKTKGTY